MCIHEFRKQFGPDGCEEWPVLFYQTQYRYSNVKGIYHKIMDMRGFYYLLQVLILDFSFKLEICRIFFPDDLILKIFDYDSTNPRYLF